MRTEFQTWLNGLTNDDGSGTTGDMLDVAWFDDQMDVIDSVITQMEADIAALQDAGFLNGYDSVQYAYTDADTITILAGGQFTASDGTKMYSVAANTTLKLSTGITTDAAAEAANTLYYIWGGETALGATAFYFHTSATSRPSELTKGALIRGAVRNDNSSNIMPFTMSAHTMMYDMDIACGGSDATEVLDATVSTAFVGVPCAAFVPAGIRLVLVCINGGYAGNTTIYQRIKGSAISTGVPVAYSHASAEIFTPPDVMVNASGLFQIRQLNSATMRVSLAGYAL